MTIAHQMTRAALTAGADLVKFQAFETRDLDPSDPQFDWLRRAELSLTEIQELAHTYDQVFFSVFGERRVEDLRKLGVKRFKVGHADRWRELWQGAPSDEEWFVSMAWGPQTFEDSTWTPILTHCKYCKHPPYIALSTIPLYPAPLEALKHMQRTDGYSDHTIGLDACKIMMARGVQVIEKHFSIEGCPRRQAWDMDEAGLAELVTWSKVCATAQNGTDKLERWGL